MSVELVTFGTDRRLVLGAAEAVRSPIYGSTWTRIRIGLQGSFGGVASNITGTPMLGCGVCRGHTNVMVSSTSDHAVGVKYVLPASGVHTAGPPAYFTFTGGAGKIFKRVGSTSTEVSTNLTRYFSNTTTVRNCFFVEITKASPKYLVFWICPSSSAGAQADVSDSLFAAAMEVDAFTSVAGILPSAYLISPGTGELAAVDEGVDGPLDHLWVYWSQTAHKFNFNIRHRRMA